MNIKVCLIFSMLPLISDFGEVNVYYHGDLYKGAYYPVRKLPHKVGSGQGNS
jgi:hypothetical protein